MARIAPADGIGSAGARVVAADTLEGDRVVNRAGEELGTVEEIMIDVQRGTVAYAVVSCGATAARGDPLFAVPWSALTRDPARHRFILDLERSRFEQAPAFDREHWPSMADDRWAAQVHQFYGVRPYWDAGSHGVAGDSRTLGA